MKVLSVQQPWADLISTGAKDIENRSWKTDFRGSLLIHTGKRFDEPGYEWLKQQGYARSYLRPISGYFLGGIVGVADLAECTRDDMGVWSEPGQWHWVFQRPGWFRTPIACPGQRSLYDLDPALTDAVMCQIERWG